MAEKEVYGRCADDCLFPVYTKEQAQEKIDAAESRANEKIQKITVFPVTITETIDGTTSTVTCDKTSEELAATSGIPQVRFMLSVGDSASIVCLASLYSITAEEYTFASVPDQNGIFYFFTIDKNGARYETFAAHRNFKPVAQINENTDDEIPNAFAVKTYAPQKPLVLGGTLNATESRVTLDGTVTAEEVETAIAQGRDVKMLLTFTDEGMTAVSVSVPLVAVKQSYLNFATVADVSAIGAANYYIIDIPVGRADLSAFAANFFEIAFNN